MEFSALIAQINELEETSREDKARYNEEVIRHQSTKAELENGTNHLVMVAYTRVSPKRVTGAQR
jgi:hypothetical protein